MSRHLVIAEVSQKQAYIFGNRELRRNIQRSAEIAHATNSDELEKYRKYFQKCCPHGYSKEQNLVYAGGGHTILQFPNRPSAEYFCKALTKKTLETYPDMELFVKIMELDTNKSIRDNLNELTRQLEIKKARRQSSFRPLNFGVELFDAEESSYEKDAEEFSYKNVKYEPAGWKSTNDLKDIAGSENFIAIVHLDGNAMGARVQNIYGRFSTNVSAPQLAKAIRDVFMVKGSEYPIIKDKKGNVVPDPDSKDTENIGFDETFEAYMSREVLPYAPETFIDESVIDKGPLQDGKVGVVGTNISFNKYFYHYEEPRNPQDIAVEILELENGLEAFMEGFLR